VTFVADESVEGPTIAALRKAGHEILSIAELNPGIEDAAVLELSRRHLAVLITADKDFGELVFRNGEDHCGILLIRLSENELEANAVSTVAAIERYGAEMPSSFSVLTRLALRIRKSTGPPRK
jgi:predicted nuclease of predicted toxin-antitoxin system